ncbi:MAG: HAD-IA family hydrolase, partial [Anaerolineae bacterium]
HRDRASLQQLLEVHGLSQTFAAIITSDDGFPRKPDPAAFESLIERQQLDREVTLAIGDRELDILAARGAGLHTCFFGTNPHEAHADVEITDYADLHAWLLRRNLSPAAGHTDIFWQLLDALVAHSEIAIDRPAGTPHPRHSDFVYPLDYGYLVQTHAADGDGVDVWVGSLPKRKITAIVCTVDLQKRDAEVKILLGCTPEEIETVLDIHNQGSQAATLITRKP